MIAQAHLLMFIALMFVLLFTRCEIWGFLLRELFDSHQTK